MLAFRQSLLLFLLLFKWQVHARFLRIFHATFLLVEEGRRVTIRGSIRKGSSVGSWGSIGSRCGVSEGCLVGNSWGSVGSRGGIGYWGMSDGWGGGVCDRFVDRPVEVRVRGSNGSMGNSWGSVGYWSVSDSWGSIGGRGCVGQWGMSSICSGGGVAVSRSSVSTKVAGGSAGNGGEKNGLQQRGTQLVSHTKTLSTL